MWRHPIKARDKSEGTTLPPLENNSRKKTKKKQWGKKFSFFYTIVVLLFMLPILLNAQCFLIQKSCLLCLYIIKKKQNKNKKTGHGTILNQPIHGTAECRVSRAHGQTESKRSRAANRNTKGELLRLRNEPPWLGTRTHVHAYWWTGSVARRVATNFDG